MVSGTHALLEWFEGKQGSRPAAPKGAKSCRTQGICSSVCPRCGSQRHGPMDQANEGRDLCHGDMAQELENRDLDLIGQDLGL